MKQARLFWFCLGSIAWLCGQPSRAAAQPTVEQASEADTQRARDAFQAGKSAFDEARYDEALEQFSAADAAVASPNTKLMIARCLTRLDRLAEAYTMLASLIRQARSYDDGRYEQAAQAAAQEQLGLQPRIVLLTVHVTDPTGEATLTISGRSVPRAEWNEPIANDKGAVEVVLSGSAGQRDSHRLALEPGSAATIELAIEAAPAPAAPAEVASAPPPRARADVASAGASGTSGSSLRTWGYVAGGVGLLGIGAFALFGTMSKADFAELEKECPRSECEASLRETADRGQTRQMLANVSLAIGAAALSAGAVLWLLGAPDDEVQVALDPTGVRIRGAL